MRTEQLKTEINSLRKRYDTILASYAGKPIPDHIGNQLERLDSDLSAKLEEHKRAAHADKERDRLERAAHGVGDGGKVSDGTDSDPWRRGQDPERGGGFAAPFLAAGWDLHAHPSVTIDTFAAVTAPAPGTYSPRTIETLQHLGADRRWMYPLMPIESVGDETSIHDFRQTGSRVVTGDVQRTLAQTDDKADVALEIEHVTEDLVTLAILVKDIPQQVLSSIAGVQQFFEEEMRFQLDAALDEHVHFQILAAGPPKDQVGANLIEQTRHAVGAMRSVGSLPSVLVVQNDDAVGLDLAVQPGTGDYIFAGRNEEDANVLWGLSIVERTGTGDSPLLLDPQRIGRLYMGQLKLDSDKSTGFRKNLVDLRMEINVLCHVRDAAGAYLIEPDE